MITKELEEIKASGLERRLTVIQGAQGPVVNIAGQQTLLLCSNDYLGLASHPALKTAAMMAVERYGTGAGASRLVSGSMEPHHALEERIARFKGTEAALVFNSGYQANLGLITALASREADIFSDKANHASIVDGCILSMAKVRRYPTRDINALEKLLKRSSARTKLIITDGIFSMDGAIAPIKEIASLLGKYNAMLIVDDAHATGVLGASGRGTLEHAGVHDPSVIQMGTFSKALGSFGAYVAGSKQLIEILINRARPFIYSTALPPAICAASIAAIEIIEAEPERRERLWQNVSLFKRAAQNANLDTMNSLTQIIPIITGDTTMRISKALLDKGIFIQGIRPPTVPHGTSRLRVCISAGHDPEALKKAAWVIKETCNEFN
ncbi:MAG: 8-amino-7-oxononanoate synthase [Deltaproteobacteria bacterium]|nr:8-amino-7-oxononanoate synthase [Deltaproteobacteria bacterium]